MASRATPHCCNSSSITGYSFPAPFADSSYPKSLKDGETQVPWAFLLHTHSHAAYILKALIFASTMNAIFFYTMVDLMFLFRYLRNISNLISFAPHPALVSIFNMPQLMATPSYLHSPKSRCLVFLFFSHSTPNPFIG